MGPVGARERGADPLLGLEVDLQIPEREQEGVWQGERGGGNVGEGREGGGGRRERGRGKESGSVSSI